MSIVKTSCRLNKRKQYILIGEKYADIFENKLKKYNIYVVSVPNNPFVDKRLEGHADLSVFYGGEGELFASPHLSGTDFEENIRNIGVNLRFIDEKIGEKYPNDSILNVCRCGNKLICNTKTASSDIIRLYSDRDDFTIIPVKQGYSACSICVVNDNAVITADRGVYSKLIGCGVEVLLINEGHIALDGFEYGFIGGAAFKVDDNVLAFTGRLDAHPDKMRIIAFLEKCGVRPIYLTDSEIFDIGGGIMINRQL